MQRSWFLALAGAAVVAAFVLWFVRHEKRRRPPEPVPQSVLTARPPPPSTASVRTDCAPLPGGGFSCGACRSDADCPGGLSCSDDRALGRTVCRGADCKEDADCQNGRSCRVIGRTPQDEPRRACVPPGKRPAAAACDPNDGGNAAVSCGANLKCVNGGCAAACVMTDDESHTDCPGLVQCIETESGPGCIPTCKLGTPCGAGKTCEFLSTENPTALCTFTNGRNCLGPNGGCPSNTECLVETNAARELTTFRCYGLCDPGVADSCGAESVCIAAKPKPRQKQQVGHCRRRCGAGAAGQCGEGERCVRAKALDAVWFCSAT